MSPTIRRWKEIWTSTLAAKPDPLRRVRGVLADSRVRQDILYPNLAELVRRHGGTSVGLSAKELRVFSQNGEDGILAEVLQRTGTTNCVFIEFGVGAGVQGNCIFLADIIGWSGLFIEADPNLYGLLNEKYQDHGSVQTLCEMVTAENINEIMVKASLPALPDIISIDIDGNDFWVWKALEVVRPRIVVIEYNGALDTRSQVVQPYNPSATWDRSDFFGASLGALVQLAQTKGYTLVHTDLTGTNAFFVDTGLAEAFADVTPVPERRANYSLQGARHLGRPSSRAYIPVPTSFDDAD